MATSGSQLTPLADLINGKNVATFGALPAAGEFLGERIFITGTKKSALWDGTTWVLPPDIRTGPATSPAAAADTNTFVDVTFATAMTAAPVVTVAILTAVAAAPYTYWITNITTTGFRLNVRRAGGALGAANWNYIAVVV